mgnify:CR=1 FL=1|jgi:hypothetical protein|tara:strand:- start:877 stop:1362 length:486 start_codon:yes stop_codon:yes gene_type:complete
MTLDQYIIQLEELQRDLPKLIEKFVNERSNYFLGAVKNRFYNQGVDGDGNKIGSYSKNTIQRKKNKSGRYKRTSHVTLADSGTWYNNLFIEYEKGDLLLSNRMGSLTQKLIEGGGNNQNPAYGKSIMLFTIDERNQWVEDILEKLEDHLQSEFKTNIKITI